MKIQHKNVEQVYGPIVVVAKVPQAKYQEMVEIELSTGERRRGRVLEAATDRALVQMFEETRGLEVTGASATFLGRTLQVGLSADMVGRVFKGDGAPRDNKPAIIPETTRDINGAPINPFSRDYPNDFIETGVSSIDVLNTLVRGQKLPIFSGAGLPHSKFAAQIARQASVKVKEGESVGGFSVVFGAMGIPFEEAEFFVNEFRATGSLDRSVLFLNLANDPVIERITLPRFVLTTAEYLAFEKGRHVLVILTDMTNYCEALREVSAARKEVPGRRGYPGYMYTDLASLYERAGRVKGKPGSITQIPILSMPEDDKTHPIPDLTGYITEGQIMMSRSFHNRGMYPGVDVLTSLSRLMPKGIGEGKTREDHSGLSSQLFASYARGLEVKELAVILGESALSETDKKFLAFANRFEEEFINQGNTHRSIEESLTLGWKLLATLPVEELKRVKPEHVKRYLVRSA